VLLLGELMSTGNEVVQLSNVLPGLGSLCVRKDKNMRKRRSQFTNLGRSQRAKVIKIAFGGTATCAVMG
jgi:hypothetical protein